MSVERDLRRELDDIGQRLPKLADDDLFVLWFLRAFITDSDDLAEKSVCGGKGDKGVDAVLIDEHSDSVFIIQGKYHKSFLKSSEPRADVMALAAVAAAVRADARTFATFAATLAPEVVARLNHARAKLKRTRSRLFLLYVTTARCSQALAKEAADEVKKTTGDSLRVLDGKALSLILRDYLDGVAPPVPSLDLEVEGGGGKSAGYGILRRYDPATDIEAWIISMRGSAVGELFNRVQSKLFARNVRGFLGNTEINEGMQDTLRSEPEYFWYYNNGVTIVCDAAEQAGSHGRDVLRVSNPQVINGQQTTRTLAQLVSGGSRQASVLVRVIRIPRDEGNSEQFDSLVSRIVSSTNWQNAIRPSDLMSNDRRQIQIERELRKFGYWYLRKRQTKGEARRLVGNHKYFMIKKEELAQAVAACELDPWVVREGKEKLFEERLYPKVFPSADARFYLSRYRMMRQVSAAAKGRPERAYVKWIVLNFVWRHAETVLTAKRFHDAFRECAERNRDRVLDPLYRANDAVYRAALQMYRTLRGEGDTAADVSTFFRSRRQIDKEFHAFWESKYNSHAGRFETNWNVFARRLKQFAEE